AKMAFSEALKIHQQNQADDVTIKPATRHYWNQIFVALVKSWPGLADREIRRITKTDCKEWALWTPVHDLSASFWRQSVVERTTKRTACSTTSAAVPTGRNRPDWLPKEWPLITCWPITVVLFFHDHLRSEPCEAAKLAHIFCNHSPLDNTPEVYEKQEREAWRIVAAR